MDTLTKELEAKDKRILELECKASFSRREELKKIEEERAEKMKEMGVTPEELLEKLKIKVEVEEEKEKDPEEDYEDEEDKEEEKSCEEEEVKEEEKKPEPEEEKEKSWFDGGKEKAWFEE